MHFSQHAAPPPLAHWVKSIWSAKGTRAEFAAPEPIVPDGCVEIVLNLADPFADHRGLQPLDLIAGQMTGPVTALATGDVDLIGVRFWPGRAGAALRLPVWQLRDQLIAASSVLRGSAQLVEALRELPRLQRINHLSAALSQQFGSRSRSTSAVDHALALIGMQRGNIAIDAVARRVGLTRRHLERRFKDEVGLGMKQFARITRVHAAIRMVDDQPMRSGADIAARCGYSDQAHMIRECKTLAGRTFARLDASAPSFSTMMRQTIGDKPHVNPDRGDR
jgi:AraC-like DNA-binding protein